MGHGHGGMDLQDPAISHLKELWDLTHDPDRPLGEKLDAVFDRETEALALPYGFVSKTDPATDTQTIEAAHGSHHLLEAGMTCPLSESYCRKTIETPDGVLQVTDAADEGWADDPAYERFGFGSYVGTTLEFGGETYGTLCFADSQPHDEPLSDGELTLVEMLAQWTSNELRVRAEERRYQREADQFEEMTRIVSHDLRNPLAVAQGHVENISDSLRASTDAIEAAHQRMNEIIEKMLTMARIDDAVTDPKPVDLGQCVSESWGVVASEGASLSLAFDDVHVAADEMWLKHLFENLFRNAIEHGSTARRPVADVEDASGNSTNGGRTTAVPGRDVEGVRIEVGVTETGFYVADDGPGIPPGERSRIFDPGFSTSTEGAGFGLNIVSRIASAHGWELSVTESDAGGARFEFAGVEFPTSGE